MIPDVKPRPARSALEHDLGVELPRRQPDPAWERAEWKRIEAEKDAMRRAEIAADAAAAAKIAARGYVLASVGGLLVALPLATDAEIEAGGTPIRIG